ncbi:MAG: cytochrome P450 [Pseudomonadota bacterium]
MMQAARYNKDFYGDAFIQDPMAHYAEMRALGPVVWLTKQNTFAATTFDAVINVLRRADVFISGKGLSLNDDVNSILIGNSLNSDGAAHHKSRSVTAPPIMPKNIEPLREYIVSLSNELAERLSKQAQFDAVTEFAQVLPLSVVIDLVGLHESGRDKMLPWAAAAFNLFDGFNTRSKAAFDTLVELRAFLDDYGTRDAVKEGGLARRIFDVAPDKGYSETEAAQLMRDYINPSLDTTISAAGFAAYYFAKFPDQWDRLRADPELIPNAIEEVVRMATPIRAFSRYVAQDTELEGVALRGGDRIIAIYASANRDPAQWDDPDQFDVARQVRKHVGFGHGVHTCMGLHLARLELTSLISAMLPRVRAWHFNGIPEISMNNTIRAFAKLPIQVDAT